jgi:hypothetical protein
LKLDFNINIVHGNLKSENSQDLAQKPQLKWYVHEFGFSAVELSPVTTNRKLTEDNHYLSFLSMWERQKSERIREKYTVVLELPNLRGDRFM